MKDYVLDADAVLRYFGAGEGDGAEKVRGLFQQAESSQARLSMSVINMGEVLYILLRHAGEHRAFPYIQALQHAVMMVEADATGTMEAARLQHRHKLGYPDSFAAALASKATLVSADPSFEKVGRPLKWMRLPKFDPKSR
jgi:predicted nucleic acid-binding protein